MAERGLTTLNNVKIFSTLQDLFQAAAQDFTHRVNAAIEAKGEFTVVLSGGETPKHFYDTLTQVKSYKENIPWQKIKFFFGDERYVPADDPKSNYHMACEHLFSKVPVLADNIYRMPTEFSDPNDAAREYELTLRTVFHLKNNEFPQFDLLYLGLGGNAHTASLMPFSEALDIHNQQLVACVWVNELNMYRITFTPFAINHAKNIIFLVTGEDKANPVRLVLKGSHDPQRYPAQLIHGVYNKAIWYLDKAAASKLNEH